MSVYDSKASPACPSQAATAVEPPRDFSRSDGFATTGVPTPARFLSQYWQKKPLLVRHAIPGFAGIVQSSDPFLAWPRAEDVESKLFVRRGRFAGCFTTGIVMAGC